MRRNLDQSEAAIIQVFEEKQRVWERQMDELRQNYASRLQQVNVSVVCIKTLEFKRSAYKTKLVAVQNFWHHDIILIIILTREVKGDATHPHKLLLYDSAIIFRGEKQLGTNTWFPT